MLSNFTIVLAILSLLLLGQAEAGAATWSGVVSWVIDGDSICVVPDSELDRPKGRSCKDGIEIRLSGIDAPEYKQPRGKQALKFVIGLSKGKKVKVIDQGLGKYKRTIARIVLPSGKQLNREIVAAGLAWWYRKYNPDDKELEQAEAGARKAKLGLWADPKPVAPWDWRKRK